MKKIAATNRAHIKVTSDLQNKEWQRIWIRYKQTLIRALIVTQQQSISKKRLKSHRLLTKIESSLATQIRSEKIELADFLYRRRVLDVISSTCVCDWLKQTSRHIIMNCQFYNNRDDILLESVQSYEILISESKRLKMMIAWLMKTNLLSQFSLVAQQLQE